MKFSEKIKIYLQSPWKATDSPYYKYLRIQPPGSIEYVNAQNFRLIQNKGRLKFNNWLKQSIKKLISAFSPNMPNAHFTPYGWRYDLIHCAHCLSKNKQPWVCDIEFVGQLWASGLHEKSSPRNKILKYVKSPHCKKILAWTEWSREGILREFPEIKEKVEVLYPGIPKQKIKKSSSKKINLLFVGRDFNTKGGQVVIKIFDKLTKKYKNVWAEIVSDIPDEILQKYGDNSKIKFHKLMTHEKLFGKVYPSADIFLYPTFSDTFGFAILEAQSFGLPVIAMKTRSTHTIQETVQDNKTGFVVENLSQWAGDQIAPREIVEQLTEKVEILIKDGKKLQKMSKNCIKEIGMGKFSIKRRNEKLEKICRKAVE